MMITDDIVYTRSQAKKLRKQGFIIPSYRVLAGKSEKIARMGHGTGTAHGDRAVVAINSEMMQQRWTKWRDDKGTFIVPYYFAKNFPGSKEDQATINSHINWFNKELNSCLRLEEVTNYDLLNIIFSVYVPNVLTLLVLDERNPTTERGSMSSLSQDIQSQETPKETYRHEASK